MKSCLLFSSYVISPNYSPHNARFTSRREANSSLRSIPLKELVMVLLIIQMNRTIRLMLDRGTEIRILHEACNRSQIE